MSIQGGSAFHVTASGVVDSGPGGILHTVTVNNAATSGTLTLYDGTSASGAELAVIDASAARGITYDAVLASGLYAALSGSGLDVTVVILPAPGYGD